MIKKQKVKNIYVVEMVCKKCGVAMAPTHTLCSHPPYEFEEEDDV